jgi:hypothetical protein
MRASGRLLGLKRADRSSWGAGPWDDEEDLYVWEHAGLLCVVWRQPTMGSLNGYVGVKSGELLHGKGYSEMESEIEVHGGLTFAGDLSGGFEQWFFGFDCNHYQDFAPGMGSIISAGPRIPKGVYRDLAYVRSEVNRLAEQVTKLMEAK